MHIRHTHFRQLKRRRTSKAFVTRSATSMLFAACRQKKKKKDQTFGEKWQQHTDSWARAFICSARSSAWQFSSRVRGSVQKANSRSVHKSWNKEASESAARKQSRNNRQAKHICNIQRRACPTWGEKENYYVGVVAWLTMSTFHFTGIAQPTLLGKILLSKMAFPSNTQQGAWVNVLSLYPSCYLPVKMSCLKFLPKLKHYLIFSPQHQSVHSHTILSLTLKILCG